MSDSDAQIQAAKSFAIALASNLKLLNAFIAAERKIIQLDPKFEVAGLDNFLSDHHYDCTIDQVSTYGRPILSDTKYWAGTYFTQVCPKGATEWSKGPELVIGSDGSVQVASVPQSGVKFSFLNMTFAQANLLFYMGTPGAHEDQSSSAGAARVKAFCGEYLGQQIVGLVAPPTAPKTPPKQQGSFMTTVGLIGKYLGQLNQAFMMYDLIKKATGAQAKADAGDASAQGELGQLRGELSNNISSVSESQGEIATTQQSLIETEMGENPGMSMEEAADAIRSYQADDLGVDEVDDVDAAQLDPAGEAIADVPVEEGGLDIAATAGEEAVGELTVDAFLEDALMLVLL